MIPNELYPDIGFLMYLFIWIHPNRNNSENSPKAPSGSSFSSIPPEVRLLG
jgi:hypothetical protein